MGFILDECKNCIFNKDGYCTYHNYKIDLTTIESISNCTILMEVKNV